MTPIDLNLTSFDLLEIEYLGRISDVVCLKLSGDVLLR